MSERIRPRREPPSITRSTLHTIGIVLCAFGLISRGILQNRMLHMSTVTGEELSELLGTSSGVTIAMLALLFEVLEGLAVPIFAVLLVNGLEKTSNAKKYVLRMFILAIVSEIPYNFALTGHIWQNDYHNPILGMFIALGAMVLYRYYDGTTFRAIVSKIMIFIGCVLWNLMIGIEYGIPMLIICTVLWEAQKRPNLKYFMAAGAALICSAGNSLFMFSPFGFLITALYRGEDGEGTKEFRYCMYPVICIMIGVAGMVLVK